MKLRIHVTAEDIAAGTRRDCETCPIAQALMRQGFTDVSVSADSILFGPYWQPASDRVADFIHEFDEGLPVEPFDFDVEIDRQWESQKQPG